ncbi:MAG: proline dehydrogenase family protein [Fibrobacterales bacterium]
MNKETEVYELGKALWHDMQTSTSTIFNSKYWYGKIMEWTLKDPEIRVDMFRFVDAFPSFKTAHQVSQHLTEYLGQPERNLPKSIHTAFALSTGSLAAPVSSALIRRNIKGMAHTFILGDFTKDTTDQTVAAIRTLWKSGVTTTVDLLGEAALSKSECTEYLNKYIAILNTLSAVPEEESAVAPRINLSLKLSSIYPHFNPLDEEQVIEELEELLNPLFQSVIDSGAFLNFDMEDNDHHAPTNHFFEKMITTGIFKEYEHVGIVVQAYRKDSAQTLKHLQKIAQTRGVPITIRLVKGAYWDYEEAEAELRGWEPPVYTTKAETDLNFEILSEVLIRGWEWTRPAIASHNIRSIAHAATIVKELGVPSKHFEFQMLYGMADSLSKAVTSRGFQVRLYTPVGDLIKGMAYLVRRLLENSSSDGFMSQSFTQGIALERLLQNPKVAVAAAHSEEDFPDTGFNNEPHIDFSEANTRGALVNAVSHKSLPYEVKVMEGNGVPSVDVLSAQRPPEVVTRYTPATIEQMYSSIAEMKQIPLVDSLSGLADRVTQIDRLISFLQRDRFKLMALQAHEVAKPLLEAEADIAEAIDFCAYYAAEAKKILTQPFDFSQTGEHNKMTLYPQGVTGVITPWNFPMAIPCGMVVGPWIMGNPIVWKPAEQSTACAHALYRLMQEAGMEGIRFVPGNGEEVGPVLVKHPDVVTISFTGSQAVGAEILKTCGTIVEGSRTLKHAVCELGGKNAIIIDDSADLDVAVPGVIYSAFAFAGQKCSACSRLYVLDSVYDDFVRRMVDAMATLRLGPATELNYDVPPVIDREAYDRLMGVLGSIDSSVEVVYQCTVPETGLYVPPTLLSCEDGGHALFHQELFGPVVIMKKVASIDEALDAVNNSRFGLTGGIFSRTPSHIDKIKSGWDVGNLYINRSCTGARVGRQPFGGTNLSGKGLKAGGPHYLYQFIRERAVSENTMRQGFSPPPSVD